MKVNQQPQLTDGRDAMAKIPRSADLLATIQIQELDKLGSNISHQDKEKTIREAAKVATEHLPPPAIQFDPLIYRLVVIFLGLVALAAITGAIILNAIHPMGMIPEVLTALGAAAIGALAGLLAPSPGMSVGSAASGGTPVTTP
jgi:hypothetical protein